LVIYLDDCHESIAGIIAGRVREAVGKPTIILTEAFGEEELQDAIQRGAIQILDDATIADMKAKRARDKARDEAAREQQAIEAGEMTDWKAVAKEWEEWENSQKSSN